MDYAQLIAPKGTPGSVATWLNNSQLQADTPEIVLEAESFIYRRLRHWRMLTAPVAGMFITGQDFITIPNDMLEPYMLWTTGLYMHSMPQRTPQDVIRSWGYDANGARIRQQPLMYYFDQNTLRFDSPPDIDYPFNLIYFQQLPPLASTNTNFLTQYYPRLLRCAIMCMATEWAKDSGVGSYDRTYWVQLTQDEIEKAQQESDRAKRATEASAVIVGGGINHGIASWAY